MNTVQTIVETPQNNYGLTVSVIGNSLKFDIEKNDTAAVTHELFHQDTELLQVNFYFLLGEMGTQFNPRMSETAFISHLESLTSTLFTNWITY